MPGSDRTVLLGHPHQYPAGWVSGHRRYDTAPGTPRIRYSGAPTTRPRVSESRTNPATGEWAGSSQMLRIAAGGGYAARCSLVSPPARPVAGRLPGLTAGNPPASRPAPAPAERHDTEPVSRRRPTTARDARGGAPLRGPHHRVGTPTGRTR